MTSPNEIVKSVQKKYNFSKAKSFDETKQIYKQMLHDKSVTDSMVKQEYDSWQGKTTNPYLPFPEDATPEQLSARKALTEIVENEMKSRKMRF